MVAGTSLRYACEPSSPAKQGNHFQLSGPWQNNLCKNSPSNSEQGLFNDPNKPHRIYLDTTKTWYCVAPGQASPSYIRKDRTIPPPRRDVRKHQSSEPLVMGADKGTGADTVSWSREFIRILHGEQSGVSQKPQSRSAGDRPAGLCPLFLSLQNHQWLLRLCQSYPQPASCLPHK